ncbi:MAG: ribonuclease P protein component [Bacteroidales bacterium]|nr:ribonuclease P protein component [Bacteroidales bacterium]
MQPGEDKSVSFSFPKKERLCSRLQMEQLLSLKQSFFSYPLKCYFQHLPLSDENPVSKMAVSVPKKLEKTAVGRNKIKRWVREAYRLNKHLLYNEINERSVVVNMLFVCVGKEKLSFALIEKAVVEILHAISCRDAMNSTSAKMIK